MPSPDSADCSQSDSERTIMSEFEIIISDENIVYGESSPYLDTPFSVRIGEIAFPFSDWTDMTYPILCIWAEDLLRLQSGLDGKTILFFMDGPFWIEVKKDGDKLSLLGISNRNSRTVVCSSQCSMRELMEELLKALNKLYGIVFLASNLPDGLKSTVNNAIKHYRTLIKSSMSTSLNQSAK